MMGNVVCKKCGATATSKCPASRGIFLEDMQLGDWESIMPAFIEDDGKGYGDSKTLHIRITVWRNEEHPLEFAATSIISILQRALDSKRLEQLTCLHEWAMAPGQTCLFGCCHTPWTINPGDEITINISGVDVTGTVKSATNYGTKGTDDWYIEATDGSYWKQQIDGGSIVSVKHPEVQHVEQQ